jgi:hypothetical protein
MEDGDEGNRTNAVSASETPISETRGAESGALDDEEHPSDPDLALIQERWPGLPEHIKSAIMALVRSVPDREHTEPLNW